MADRKVTIDIETRKTGTGTEAAVKELGGLSASASRAQGNVSESFKKIQSSVGRVTRAVGALRNLFMGFGIAQAAVAVMSAGVEFRQDARTSSFRSLIERMGGRFSDLPAASFAEAGTMVNTCTLTVRAPK